MGTLYRICGAGEDHKWEGELFELEEDAENCLADIHAEGIEDAWIDTVRYWSADQWADYKVEA